MAVTTLICAGSNQNTVARALSASTSYLTASDVNPLFPLTNLGDGFSAMAFRFQTTSSGRIDTDKNAMDNWSMEVAATSSSTVLANWVVDSGTVTRTSSVANSGSFSMSLGAGAATAHQDVLVNADERFTLFAALRGDATNFSKISVQNLQTFNYLTSAGAWQVAQTFCITGPTAAGFSVFSRTASIEAFSPTQMNDTMWLRITVASTAGTVFADDVVYSPATGIVGLFGFLNIDPGVVVKIISSSDGFTTQTTEATMVDYRPSFFYYTTTPIDRRYIRVQFGGVNSSASGPIFGGELFLGQPRAIVRTFDPSYSLVFSDAQERQETVIGGMQVFRLDTHSVRTINLPYRYTNLAEYQEMRDVARRAQHGAAPAVIVPASTDGEVCLLARIEPTFTAVQGPMPNYFEGSSLKATELPFPAWVA